MARNKEKNWLFVKYKKEHPDKIPKNKKKKSNKGLRIVKIIAFIILFNILAALIASILNSDIRCLIF